jgi:hypothetical protein
MISLPNLQRYFMYVIMPFSLGCFLYAVGRPLSILIIGDTLKLHNNDVIIKLPQWLIYSAPDGLWLYSFLMWLILTWRNEASTQAFFWYLLLIAFAISSELLQKYSFISGTFDRNDMLAYLFAILLCVLNYFANFKQ